MEPPEVRYALSGNVHVAYQVLGDGPLDLVLGTPAPTNLGVWWEWPPNAEFFQGLASLGRLILFDKRGVGLSDRAVGVPPLGERMDDIRAVMDAAGSSRAILLGISESAPMSLLFAASYPKRTAGLVLVGGFARGLGAPGYPWGPSAEQAESNIRSIEREWGTPENVRSLARALAPGVGDDPEFVRWLTKLFTYGASPASAAALERMNSQIDVSSVLGTIHVPALVLAEESEWALGSGRYMADRIPGARFAAIPGANHMFTVDPKASRSVLQSIRSFVADLPGEVEADRILMTVLFTDVVSSTRRAAELGDRAWAQLLGRYLESAREQVTRFRGHLVKSTGDGVLATFDGPTRAVRCASALRDDARRLGLETRAGLHTGECLLKAGDIQGVAVHIAARVSELAEPDEVLVSGTVRDLSFGSEIQFADRGTEALRGLDGRWKMYSVGGLRAP
jgi:class 3 adenylate cyclase